MYFSYSLLIWSKPLDPTVIIFRFFPSLKIFLKLDLASLQIQRKSEIHRVTNETDVIIRLNLDGTGKSKISSGIAFLDHMLHQISSHGLFDLKI